MDTVTKYCNARTEKRGQRCKLVALHNDNYCNLHRKMLTTGGPKNSPIILRLTRGIQDMVDERAKALGIPRATLIRVIIERYFEELGAA